MIINIDFEKYFELLTGNKPFPWQTKLYEGFLKGHLPQELDIPTGLGKTATIAVWLLALASHVGRDTIPDFPRRLVYVVNRRTIVDQATYEVEQIRKALVSVPELNIVADRLRKLAAQPSDVPLAISTLRGQFTDNAEWRDDPSRPAIVAGTVDMVGSRLLFSGYGRGFKSRPLHAGFLAQDTLLIHDEAHLEPAFQQLLSAIELEQRRRKEFRRFRIMALTATSRSKNNQFSLSDADKRHHIVQKRINAKKEISLHCSDDEKNIASVVAELALRHEGSGHAILIFLNKLEGVQRVAKMLPQGRVQTLTGTMRGLERDRMLKKDRIFARFIPKPEAEPQQGTVYLVCTSAGEVGVNISADHLVCDLTPFDSMAQRFGRVNRFGEGGARIDVVYPNWLQGSIEEIIKEALHCKDQKKQILVLRPNIEEVQKTLERLIESKLRASDQQWLQHLTAPPTSQAIYGVATPENMSPFTTFEEIIGVGELRPVEIAQIRTLALLEMLPLTSNGCLDASPAALNSLPAQYRQSAFTPQPDILPVNDILFDNWALTSIRDKLPGRPPVADWLHGVADWEPPQSQVAWREEVSYLTNELRTKYQPEALLEDYPLKPHELLRDRSDRVFVHLKKLAEIHKNFPVWLVIDENSIVVKSLGDLIKDNKDILNGRTVLLPPEVGGLSENGMIDSTAAFDERREYDVADCWIDEKGGSRRLRVWGDTPAPDGMRLIRTIDIHPDTDEQDEDLIGRYLWCWYVRPKSADDDSSRIARKEQKLTFHLQVAERFAAALAAKLLSEPDEAKAIVLAAKWHDLGKRRAVWQRSIGNSDPSLVLAKSGEKKRTLEITDYRHELGSLIDVSSDPEFHQLTTEVQDLVLHLIAAHHGRARPHFPADEAFDPEQLEECTARIVCETPRRFARLQRKYGRWGLAYLESLVRAADALASQSEDSGTNTPISFTVA